MYMYSNFMHLGNNYCICVATVNRRFTVTSWVYLAKCRVRISIRTRCTTLCDKVFQSLATGRWFSPGPPVFSTNKTDLHNKAKILLKVRLNTIKPTKNQMKNKKFRWVRRPSCFLLGNDHLTWRGGVMVFF